MQFGIWYVAGALVGGYLIGSVIQYGCDRAIIGKATREAKEIEKAFQIFGFACRDVLSENWYKKVLRKFKERLAAEGVK